MRRALLVVLSGFAGCEGQILLDGPPEPDASRDVPVVAAAGGQAGGLSVTAGGNATADAGFDAGSTVTQPPTREAVLDEVMFSQAVTAPLLRQGVMVPAARREVPLVHSRELMLQVTAEALVQSFVNRPVEVVLELESADAGPSRLSAVSSVEAVGRPFAADAGARFVLPARAIAPDVRFRISLNAAGTGQPLDRFPSDGGFAALEPWPERMPLRVMLVPVSNDCAMAPAMTPELRRTIETYLWNTYPVNDLEVRVHAPISITGCDDGDVMDRLSAMRRSEGLGPQWYYQAQLSQNLGGYAYVFEDDNEVDADRVGWVGYWPGGEPVNVAHELGHNHGSDHTFSSGASPPYQPAAGKAFGGRAHFGFAVRGGHHPWVSGDIGGRVFPPTLVGSARADNGRDQNFYDVMSYESPYWVSAFTYSEWANRMRASNRWAAFGARGAALPVVSMTVSRSADVRWSSESARLTGTLETASVVSGEREWPVLVEVVRGCDAEVARLRFVEPFVEWQHQAFELRLGARRYVHQP